MKWKKRDLAQYLKGKEYVDTILIPLIPFQISNDQDMEKDSFKNEILSIFSNEMEKELSGRILLTPTYYYIKSTDLEVEKERVNSWVTDLKEQPFQHIFFITYESKWKKVEKDMDGELIWLPAIQTGDIHSKEMQLIIREQVNEIGEFIRSYWR